jgi:hypothetical protein
MNESHSLTVQVEEYSRELQLPSLVLSTSGLSQAAINLYSQHCGFAQVDAKYDWTRALWYYTFEKKMTAKS